MNTKAVKSTGLSIALAAAFLVAAGGSTAFAQDWRASYNDYNSKIYSDQRQRLEERRGFNDGLIAGRRDALARFSFNPSCSMRYQLGGFYYRRGFQSGYSQAYRRYAGDYEYGAGGRYNRDSAYNRNRQPGYYDQWGNFRPY